jgi:hypothetical protein
MDSLIMIGKLRNRNECKAQSSIKLSVGQNVETEMSPHISSNSAVLA